MEVFCSMLNEAGLKLLRERYLLKDEDGNIVETPEEMFERVARHGARTEKQYQENLEVLSALKFLPSRMPYMGTERPFSSSCFVLGPLEDSTESILDIMAKNIAIQRYGGGAGFNFSRLRPQGDLIQKTKGRASGPVSFMYLYDSTMRVFLRAGNKMGAQMAVLNVDHPDIEKFITCKDKEGDLITFNISIAVTDAFMQAVEDDADWNLVFNGKVYKTVKARYLWGKIAEQAWRNGEPGIIYIDTVNRNNKYPFPVEASNPCGEQHLPPNFSCNLGSINLGAFVKDGHMDYNKLERVIRIAVRFLDTSLDNAWFPLPELKETATTYRNIGLGVMGFADALLKMGIPYDSDRAIKFADNVGEFLTLVAKDESRGRNTALTAIAPTGSIATIAGCSYGIEPMFGVVSTKHTLLGNFVQVSETFVSIAKDRRFYSDRLMNEVTQSGSVQHAEGVPDDVRELFKTANEIPLQRHIEIQAAFQKHICNAISKTINLPNLATVETVMDVFTTAYRKGCKSITVYRDGSRGVQAIDSGEDKKKEVQWNLYVKDAHCLSGSCSL